jgi:8-oxo-dGTP pyrophosphatase MutT (NUDIX family)
LAVASNLIAVRKMDFKDFINRLEIDLKKPLPGLKGQMDMVPLPPEMDRFQIRERPDARRGGVLLLFYPDQNQPWLPLILRPKYNGTHSGQISFPGGKQEPDDPDLQFTALREAEEEIGIDARKVEIIGELSQLYIPPSNFSVKPFVGFLNEKPRFIPDATEVEKVLPVPFQHFMNPQNLYRKIIEPRPGYKLDTPFFEIEGNMLWGATAMMLSELMTISKSILR